jgi:hypothetical protein
VKKLISGVLFWGGIAIFLFAVYRGFQTHGYISDQIEKIPFVGYFAKQTAQEGYEKKILWPSILVFTIQALPGFLLILLSWLLARKK